MRNYEAIKIFEENENDEDLEIGNQEQEHEHEQEQISNSTTTKTKLKNKIVVDEQQPKSHRLLSLDVFRGLTVALMILVDDAGGLIPALNHSPWNGLTIADFQSHTRNRLAKLMQLESQFYGRLSFSR
ncbi:hypothetical protein RYX36_022534 [Vicia faba]